MNAITSLFTSVSIASAVLYLALAAFSGILIGRLEFKNIKLGIAGVLFSGLFLSHLGARPQVEILHFAREFGLILFVYAIGLDIGPRFVSSFKNEGLKLNLFAISIVLLNAVVTLALYFGLHLDPALITGIMCGAVTNTPSLGTTQQILMEFSKNGMGAANANLSGMGYAIAYPFGIFGIILVMLLLRIIFRIKVKDEVQDYTNSLTNAGLKLESVTIKVTNPQLFNRNIGYIRHVIDKELVISRILRGNEWIIPIDETQILDGDILYGVSQMDHIENLEIKIGQVTISEKREISGTLAMAHILVTNRKYAGKTIQQIGIYRRYEANITRIFRAGIEILPSLDTSVEFGDTVRVVGKADLLNDIKNELGNSIKELAMPNTVPIFIGIFLGVILGSIPIFIPGLPAPAKLGLAGGPLLVAILLGHFGRVGKMDFYMTPGANMMLREIGITLFLAAVGLLSGANFVNTIWNGGYWWMLYGAVITFIPIMIVASVARLMKVNYLKICGLISGTMTDPPALEFANSLAPVPAQATAYASVYPLAMFLRILLAQILLLFTM
ncbi:MAG: putative transporter [Ignavibacteria bacterium]|nr:putative transporter [Ignavibacteria bacterium]